MALPRVYIETTIPSFYHNQRSSPSDVARRDWTKQWWSLATSQYELVTSAAVIAELSTGPEGHRENWLALVRDLPALSLNPEVAEIVRAYVKHYLMPASPTGDALHLALASYYRCDFLVTWNCKHLANANKFGHIRRINTMLGLWVPILTTPLELLGVHDHEPQSE